MFQLGSSLLDACVLAVVSRGDTYGYLLTQNIRTVLEVSESTLYPVLRRLQSENMLSTYDSPYNGRNRRYYHITPEGLQHLEFLQDNWEHFKAAVDYLLVTTAANRGATAQDAQAQPQEAQPQEAQPQEAEAHDTQTQADQTQAAQAQPQNTQGQDAQLQADQTQSTLTQEAQTQADQTQALAPGTKGEQS